MITVLAAMAASTVAGLLAERRSPAFAHRLATFSLLAIFWVVLPFLIVCTLPSLRLDTALVRSLGLGWLALAIAGVAAWFVGSRVLRLPRPSTGALICSTVIANTGYFGLPFTSTLLGRDDLATAIAYDTLISGPMFYVVGMAIGGRFGAGDRGLGLSPRALLLRNPPLLAAIAGLLLPSTAVPDALVDTAHDSIWVLLVLGFVAVGATLATEADEGAFVFPPRLDPPVRVALLLRLVLAPAIFLGLTALAGGAPAAFRVEAAMPAAIGCLIIAHTTKLDLRLSAATIVWSTAIVAVWGIVATLL
ncbi:MAG TPA: transporter [Solirubrobacteraceae bacterium]|nr:transporter [Solirubrobacteraceae bacterium]